MKRSILASTVALVILANSALAHSPKAAVETVTIYGSATSAQAATGAAQYIGEEELAKFVYARSEELPAWFSFWFSAGRWRALAKDTEWAFFLSRNSPSS